MLLSFILTLTGCHNDDDSPIDPIDQLPPATQAGENTFGFFKNGEPVAIKNTMKMSALYQGGFIQFGAGGVYMFQNDPFRINRNYSLIDKARFVILDENDPCCNYYDFDDAFEGRLRFSKIDTENYIISGTFEFSTVTENCDTIRFTNGRFDLKYVPSRHDLNL